jgi:glycosyltransferase involved in cell wall biosynthesis
MRIVWLCHYFAPEMGAPQARLLELSKAFREAGHDVAAVTCFANHPTGVLAPGDAGVKERRDEIDGIAVFRCKSYVTPNKGIVRKTLGHLSFTWTGRGGLSRAAKEGRPDFVIVSSPTFFSVFTAWWWCGRRGIPWVFEVRDLWPAVFVELGVLKNRFVIWVLERMELFLYRKATRVVTVTKSFKDHIARRGIDAAKIGVVTNGVDLDRFTPGPRDEEFARSKGIGGKFVVLYLGAHGISHALARMLDVAEKLRDLDDVRIVFVGEGAEKEQLVAEAKRRALPNVVFHDGVPKDEVIRWYRTAHVGLVPLRDVPLFTTFIPSKMFEQLACGLPVVGSVAGEAAEILTASGGARVVRPEDADAIAREIRALHRDADLRRRLGEAGRAFVVANYSRKKLAADYVAILESAK